MDGKLCVCAPKVDTLFVSAGPNGLDVWVKTFVKMFSSDASHADFMDTLKARFVVPQQT